MSEADFPDAGQEDPLVRRAKERVGTTLKDKWTIDRLIGVGGMAVVYKATHRNGKEVAVKMLHPELSIDANIKARFLREGYAANRVKHKGAVTVDDDDTADDGAAFLVMELLEGETLDARLTRKGGRLPVHEVIAIADALLDVLVAAHAEGIVHRDLKPENVFLTNEKDVKVLDFGIARLREASAGSPSATRTGSMMGTPAFMPPEQAKGRWDEVDGRTDLWAVGATLFTLLTGVFVHEAETPNEALAMAVTQPARSIASVDPTLPAAVVELVDKALEYDKAERWPDAQSMQYAVREVYQALQSAEGRAPALSAPDVASAPDAAVAYSGVSVTDSQTEVIPVAPEAQSLGPGAMTTARGVAASASRDAPSNKLPLLIGLGVAGTLGMALVIAVVVALSGSGDDASGEPSVAAAGEPGPPAQPVAVADEGSTSADQADENDEAVDEKGGGDGEVVSIDELPISEQERLEAEKAVEAADEPSKSKAFTSTAPKPAARPQPKPAPAPAPAKKKSDFDPFAKRR